MQEEAEYVNLVVNSRVPGQRDMEVTAAACGLGTRTGRHRHCNNCKVKE